MCFHSFAARRPSETSFSGPVKLNSTCHGALGLLASGLNPPIQPFYPQSTSITLFLGFLGSSAGKESVCNAGDPQFNSLVGKFSWRRDRLPTSVFLGSPDGSTGKESACSAGDLGSILGLGRSPGEGKGYPLQYSGLENCMDLTIQSMGPQRVGRD